MKTNRSWLRFNYEYHCLRERLGRGDANAEDEARSWAERWLADKSLGVVGRPGYTRSWLSKVGKLLGPEEARRMMEAARGS